MVLSRCRPWLVRTRAMLSSRLFLSRTARVAPISAIFCRIVSMRRAASSWSSASLASASWKFRVSSATFSLATVKVAR